MWPEFSDLAVLSYYVIIWTFLIYKPQSNAQKNAYSCKINLVIV
jgi:hypothetical protein